MRTQDVEQSELVVREVAIEAVEGERNGEGQLRREPDGDLVLDVERAIDAPVKVEAVEPSTDTKSESL